MLHLNTERGRFETSLLFRERPCLRNNYDRAEARLAGLLRSLKRNPELANAYDAAIKEYIDLGAVEEVSPQMDANPGDRERRDVYYLPHRAVYDPNKVSSKCRIVFDASASTITGRSLNSYLMAGPPLQLEIVNLALRFRARPIALVGDIAKMFLNIDMHPSCRDYLRFLWREPGDATSTKIYRFTTLIFGATDSPFQAITCLQKLVQSKLADPLISEVDRKACRVILRDTYVDDLSTGGDTVEEVGALMHAVDKILGSAHFKVKKWKTNSAQLLARIPEEDRAPTKAVTTDEGDDPYPIISEESKMLGLGWDPESDTLQYHYEHLPDLNLDSMTSVASLLAKIYDPLGLVSPFVLKARHILKALHLLKLGWKDKVPIPMLEQWHLWVNQIPNLTGVTVPRHIPIAPETEMHGFSDASVDGYGFAIYLRTQSEGNTWETRLLMARSKVSPIKELTVPKLELTAAEIAASALVGAAEELHIPLDHRYLWTDSEIVLHWLQKEPHTLLPFMANRIRRIQQHRIPFSYVPTQDNPADIASRGCEAQELTQALWLNGPPFLSRAKDDAWPPQKVTWEGTEARVGVKKQYVFNFHTLVLTVPFHPSQPGPTRGREILLDEYHSDYDRLIRQTASVGKAAQRWKNLIRKGESVEVNETETRDWTEWARLWWIRNTQREAFEEELGALEAGHGVSSKSPLYTLSPLKDPEGILRVGGRLAQSSLPYSEKHPIILDRSHRFTYLMAKRVHDLNYHAGVDWLHHHLRQEYWIPSSRVLLRNLVKNCLLCERERAKPAMQLMAPLPEARVERQVPFTHVGVDYAGRLWYRTPRGPIQGRLLLFTCMATRAVHLEITDTEGVPDLVLALHRLIGTRGVPTYLYSDHGQTFQRTRSLLKDPKQRLQARLPEIRWQFSTELAPHTGGVWERMIQLVKRPLRKALSNASHSYAELISLCKGIEGMVNDRPLAATSADSMDAVTPSMLVIGRRLAHAALGPLIEADPTAEWQHHLAGLDQIWDAWALQYRQGLQSVGKWGTVHANLQEGDLVLVEIAGQKRFQWPLARVVSLDRSSDGLVRGATVSYPTRLGHQELHRSVHQLYPLEGTRPEKSTTDDTPATEATARIPTAPDI